MTEASIANMCTNSHTKFNTPSYPAVSNSFQTLIGCSILYITQTPKNQSSRHPQNFCRMYPTPTSVVQQLLKSPRPTHENATPCDTCQIRRLCPYTAICISTRYILTYYEPTQGVRWHTCSQRRLFTALSAHSVTNLYVARFMFFSR